jgi:phage I-like protein
MPQFNEVDIQRLCRRILAREEGIEDLAELRSRVAELSSNQESVELEEQTLKLLQAVGRTLKSKKKSHVGFDTRPN